MAYFRLQAAETRVRPSAMREVALEMPSVGWGDVGGLEDIKQSLKARCPSTRCGTSIPITKHKIVDP